MGNDCPTPDFDGQLYNKDIKTILTHEQFEQNAYRLEEK